MKDLMDQIIEKAKKGEITPREFLMLQKELLKLRNEKTI